MAGRRLVYKPWWENISVHWTHLEVESVEIIEVGEGKNPCECEEEVEGEDEPVVSQNERVEPPLVTDGSDEAGE